MLDISDICKLYSSGVDIKLRKKISKENPLRKGLWDPAFNEVNIYLPMIESREDFNLTLIHEFVHAQKDYYTGEPGNDEKVDALTLHIYFLNPKLPKEIIDFYQISIPKRFR